MKKEKYVNTGNPNTITCNVHKESFFIEGNMNHLSIHNELCLIYNAIFKLDFIFAESLNKSYTNLTVEHLPYIVYGGYTIKREFLHSFLKQLVSIPEVKRIEGDILLGTTDTISITIEQIEKIILFDLQMSLNMYTYFEYNEKTNYLWKFLKFLYQPLISFRSNLKDNEASTEINKLLGVTSRYEALENVRNIIQKIENFVIGLGGDKYVKGLGVEREINSMDLLIYAAIKAINRVINKEKRKKYQLELDIKIYPGIKLLTEEIDNIILNNIEIKNSRSVTSPDNLNIQKFTYIDHSYKRYLDTPPETAEVKKRTMIRKSIISAFFVGIIFLLKVTYKTK